MPPPGMKSQLILLATLFALSSASESTHNCFVKQSSRSPCPPFTTSTPPFPFSVSLGCGHPMFRIHCSQPHSTITINNQLFSLLRYDPNSTSLRLSLTSADPSFNTTPHCSARFTTRPHHPINLSNSPFKISDSSCSRLAALRPCSAPDLVDCRHCPWECQLINNPVSLLRDCGSMKKRTVSQQGCQTDVLEYLDGLFNRFGIEIEWDAASDAYFSSCRDCEASNGVCGFDSSDPGKKFVCFKRETTLVPPLIRRHSNNFVSVLLSAVFVCSLVVLITIVAIKFRPLGMKSLNDSSEDPTTLFLHHQRSASLLPPVFTYDELESATDGFDSSRNIGDGGFGSVYLARLNDGRVVAVKLHRRHTSDADADDGGVFFTKSFCNEILILSSIEHPNLVKLHGYCSDPRGLLLIYDFFPNGTLADHLHKQQGSDNTLTWKKRIDIAIQVAAAIEYLHSSVKPPVVHRDITTSNIFMECDMRVKVGDFGLSRLMVGPESAGLAGSVAGGVTTGPQGTPGYLDPDYHKCFRLTEKSDVYSFGVVLMELITGMRAVDGRRERRERREMTLADLVVVRIQTGRLREVVDEALGFGGELGNGVGAAAELAFRCVAADKDDRPDMAEVAAELRRIRACIS